MYEERGGEIEKWTEYDKASKVVDELESGRKSRRVFRPFLVLTLPATYGERSNGLRDEAITFIAVRIQERGTEWNELASCTEIDLILRQPILRQSLPY